MDTKDLHKLIVRQQKSEITEYHIYDRLAKKEKDPNNKKVLKDIAKDEKKHHDYWKSITAEAPKPNWLKVHYYVFLARFLGISFGIRLMERGETFSAKFYETVKEHYPKAEEIQREEEEHEHQLITMLNDRQLQYAGAIVLGLNDALVELTGSLAGLTLALQNGPLIGATGFIIGFAASLSMAASGYLQSREDDSGDESDASEKNPIISAVYTGVAYLITVLFLIAPYFFISNVFYALATTLAIAVTIIGMYTFYVTTAKKITFTKRFTEMACISLGVALISFGVGWVVRNVFGVEA